MSQADVPAPAATGPGRLYWAMADALTLVRAELAHIARVPEQLMDVTVQPIMFVLLFAYVIGSAIAVPGGGGYHQFLMPGIFTQSLAFTAASTAVAVSTDMAKGVIDRFRSLPMARSAVLVGKTVAGLVKKRARPGGHGGLRPAGGPRRVPALQPRPSACCCCPASP